MSSERTIQLSEHVIAIDPMQIEQDVLGMCLINPTCLNIVMSSLKQDDFYHSVHQAIFFIMYELTKKGNEVDIVTVSETAKELKLQSDIGGRVYVNELAVAADHIASELVDGKIELIKNYKTRRNLVAMAYYLLEKAQSIEKVIDILPDLEQKVLDVVADSNCTKTLHKTKDFISSVVTEMQDPNSLASYGLESGWPSIDKILRGLKPSYYMILAARPGMGKTTMLLNTIVYNAVHKRVPCLFFSIEMNKEDIIRKMISYISNIPDDKFRPDRLDEGDRYAIDRASQLIADAPIYIEEASTMSPAQLQIVAKKIQLETKGQLGLIGIDYIQLMRIEGMDNPVQELTDISQTIKQLTKDMKVPVIALSQLSRNVELRSNKRPLLSDLRGSGSLEQDANSVLFIYRDDYYNKKSEKPGIAEVEIAKNRSGPTGVVELSFYGAVSSFLEK